MAGGRKEGAEAERGCTVKRCHEYTSYYRRPGGRGTEIGRVRIKASGNAGGAGGKAGWAEGVDGVDGRYRRRWRPAITSRRGSQVYDGGLAMMGGWQ